MLAQDPAAGDEGRRRARTVTLVVAKAPPDVEVPDVVDQTQDDADAGCADAGFEVRDRRARRSTRPTRTASCIDQSPAGGEQRKKGSQVTIVVGKLRRRR